MKARKMNRTLGKMMKLVLGLVLAVSAVAAGTGCDEDYNFGYGTGFRSGTRNQQDVPLDLGEIDCWFTGDCGSSHGH